MTKKLPAGKSPGPESFISRFYQVFREELTPIMLKLFQKHCRGRHTPNDILWGHHCPDTKSRQSYHKKENYRPISLWTLMWKSSTKYLQFKSNNILEESCTMVKWDLSQWCKFFSVFVNQPVWHTTSANWNINNIWSSP